MGDRYDVRELTVTGGQPMKNLQFAKRGVDAWVDWANYPTAIRHMAASGSSIRSRARKRGSWLNKNKQKEDKAPTSFFDNRHESLNRALQNRRYEWGGGNAGNDGRDFEF